jgi:hypothetical protein
MDLIEDHPTPPEVSPPAPVPPGDLPPAAPAAPAAPPPAAAEVLSGSVTEQTAELQRKLDAREKQLRERETKLSEKELLLQRRAEASKPAKQKESWLSGNALLD